MQTVQLRDGFGNDMYLIGGPANDVKSDVKIVIAMATWPL